MEFLTPTEVRPPNLENLTTDQLRAYALLKGQENVFITGAAGTGKSFLIKEFLKEKDIPILASTGAAAILVGGRTFHSFFGLGIMEGGFQATVDRALKNKRLISRLKKSKSVIIDEISMISGPTLFAAEAISRQARGSTTPWGGLRIIAVGDFAQLPPVNRFTQNKEWAFLSETWRATDFQTVILNKIMRTSDQDFLEILGDVRLGHLTPRTIDFLNSRKIIPPSDQITRLFPHRADVEKYNLQKLELIPSEAKIFETSFTGKSFDVEQFKKHSPLPDQIRLKVGALVMLRQNDLEGRWVNGSLATVLKMADQLLTLQLVDGGRVNIEKTEFSLLNAEGESVVKARNFPVNLAWAMTIHKAQGTSLDRMMINLKQIWEPGQAYVALSRAKSPQGLYIEDWSPGAIFSDPTAMAFYKINC